jgi:hypothetical protein
MVVCGWCLIAPAPSLLLLAASPRPMPAGLMGLPAAP